jgi:hypothetical protein
VHHRTVTILNHPTCFRHSHTQPQDALNLWSECMRCNYTWLSKNKHHYSDSHQKSHLTDEDGMIQRWALCVLFVSISIAMAARNPGIPHPMIRRCGVATTLHGDQTKLHKSDSHEVSP